jgi:hypothetical protein
LEISLCTPETFDYDRVCSVRAYEGFDVGCHAVTSATSPSVIVISGNFAADVIENAKVRVKLAVAEIKGDRRAALSGELIRVVARGVTNLTRTPAC